MLITTEWSTVLCTVQRTEQYNALMFRLWFVVDSVLLRRISCTFHHSVCQLSVVVLFPSPRPYSGTHCWWMSSHPLHFRSSASVWRHSFSTNHFL